MDEKCMTKTNSIKTRKPAIAMCDCQDMDTKTWLKIKEHGVHYDKPNHPEYVKYTISGSRIACVLGHSPWMSPFELAFRMKGLSFSNDKPVNEASKATGHAFENAVATMLHHVPGYEGTRVFNDATMYQHPEHPWMFANLDRKLELPTGETAIGEVKTTHWRNYDTIKKWKQGIVPKYYEDQCRWYMAIMDIGVAIIICAWGFTPDSYAVIRIDRDLEIEKEMIAKAEEFLQKLDACDIPSSKDFSSEKPGFETLFKVYGKNGAGTRLSVSGTDEDAEKLETLIGLLSSRRKLTSETRIKQGELETEINAAALDYLEKMTSDSADNEFLDVDTPSGRYTVAWKKISKKGLDVKRLLAEKGELVKDYIQDQSYRVLSVSICDDEEPEPSD